MNNKNAFVVAALLISLLSGCASSPESDPAYVSLTQYQNYNCNQISAEMQRVSAKLEQTSQRDVTNKVIESAVTAYAFSQGAAVFAGNNSEDATATKRLRNQYDVLEQTAIQKECSKR